MARIVTAIEIERPVEDVFEFMTNLDNAPQWAVDLVEVRYDGRIARGSKGTDVRRMGRKQVEMPWEVTRFEPPRAVAFTYREPFAATATFAFEPTPTGTRVSCDTTLQLKGLYRLLAPMVAREGRKTDTEQFRKAKRLLEGRPAPAPRAQSQAGGAQPGGS